MRGHYRTWETGVNRFCKGGSKCKKMRIHIKEIDWDGIWYSQDRVHPEDIGDYDLTVDGVSGVIQSPNGDSILLLDRLGDLIVKIDGDAFYQMEVM